MIEETVLFHFGTGSATKRVALSNLKYTRHRVFYCIIHAATSWFSLTVRFIALNVTFSGFTHQSQNILAKHTFFLVLAFVSMTPNVSSAITTHTSFSLSFSAYHLTFLKQFFHNLVSARTTMVMFLAANRSSTFQTSLFIDLRGFIDQHSPMTNPLFGLDPFNKLFISTLYITVKPNFSDCSPSSRTLHLHVSLCLSSHHSQFQSILAALSTLFPV